MSKMNKTAIEDARVTSLERDLIQEQQEKNEYVGAGRRRVNTPFKENLVPKTQTFQIMQGTRYRHPKARQMLNKYKTLHDNMERADRNWEKLYQQNTEQVKVRKEYQALEGGGVSVHQMGLVATANKNYLQSKKMHSMKLGSQHMVGV